MTEIEGAVALLQTRIAHTLLEYVPIERPPPAVGGLNLLKAWIGRHASACGGERGVPTGAVPRLVVLIGVPGTGKSLSCALLSNSWRLPLLRLDMNTVCGMCGGERYLREALATAARVGPHILWLDKVNTPFDYRHAHRIALTTLRFLSDPISHQRWKVFVVAEANDVRALPEWFTAGILAGSGDCVFVLDLPHDQERREIFSIYLHRANPIYVGRNVALDDLVERTCGMVGRDIAHIVHDALFRAFTENRELRQDDLLRALSDVVPLNRAHPDRIEAIRQWKTSARTFPASSEPERQV